MHLSKRYYAKALAESDKKVKRLLDCLADVIAFGAGEGMVDGGHHKQWVIDQMIRHAFENNEEAYETYIGKINAIAREKGYDEWDVGIAP